MRIVVHGQQAFGKSVLEALLERGENVVGVYCAPDPAQGGRVDPLKEAALARNLPVFQPRSFRNKPEVWEEFARVKAALCVMAYVTLIVPESVLNAAPRGTIQYHPSLLPRHRGPSSINWPIIMGETRTGLSIFWPDQGLDTGPILLQKEVEIRDSDTLGSLYFDRLYPLGVAALLEAVDLVRAGTAPRIVQDESQAPYEGCGPRVVRKLARGRLPRARGYARACGWERRNPSCLAVLCQPGGHMARPRAFLIPHPRPEQWLLVLLLYGALVGCTVRLIQPHDEVIDRNVSRFHEEFLRFTIEQGRTRGTFAANQAFYDTWQPRLTTLTARALAANPSGR